MSNTYILYNISLYNGGAKDQSTKETGGPIKEPIPLSTVFEVLDIN